MVTKIIIFLLVLSILNIIRELWRFVQCYSSGETYDAGKYGLFLLAASVSYTLTIIFTGVA